MQNERLGVLSVIAGAIMMGSLVIFVRNINLNAVQTSFFRFFFGFLFLLIFSVLSRRKISFERPKMLLIMSLLSIMVVNFYIASIQLIPAGTAALLLYMAPVYVLPIAYLSGEVISRKIFVSIPLSISGLYLMLSPTGVLNAGIIFGLISGFVYALYFMVIKRIRDYMQSIELTTAYLGISSLILAPSLVIYPIGEVNLMWLIGLGLIPTALAFTLFNFGLKYCKLSEGPVFALIEPISASLFGLMLFGETFTPIEITGMILVLAGVAIALKA
ncbi:putative permease [Archaeoglobus sulfaticallidus PM70-1]|uniref:Putative permease n=1 Tax=Archaeoglobus sulfaticallidus PM70-1 TaxID=387631 RepID=N0BG04_9EURY|nr:EamA family transporter [Archaeoglobus sulfaticallidus]AGK61953.1 putative permease [Archaeoglobus sulfaticallidus PM70-1]